MNRAYMAGVLFVLLLSPLSAYAVVNGLSPIADPGIPQNGTPTSVFVTCYAPGAGGNIEGGFETSRPGQNGRAVPCTLDDFRLKRNGCWYVTLAGNPDNYNKYYSIPRVDYISVEDGMEYIMTNVVGYVHDTGSAFRSGSCANYSGMCAVMNRHFDVAYGNFSGGGNVSLVNKTPFCASSNQTWLQIGGQVTVPASVTSAGYAGYLGGNTGISGYGGQTGAYPYTAAFPTGSPYASASPIPVQSSYGSTGGTYTTAIPAQTATPVNTAGYASSPYSALTTSNAATQLQAAIQPQTQVSVTSQTIISGAPSISNIVVQPHAASRLGNILISWTSLNMRPGSCAVSLNGNVLAKSEEGSKSVPAQTLPTGTLTFVLTCTSADGTTRESTDTITVQ